MTQALRIDRRQHLEQAWRRQEVSLHACNAAEAASMVIDTSIYHPVQLL